MPACNKGILLFRWWLRHRIWSFKIWKSASEFVFVLHKEKLALKLTKSLAWLDIMLIWIMVSLYFQRTHSKSTGNYQLYLIEVWNYPVAKSSHEIGLNIKLHFELLTPNWKKKIFLQVTNSMGKLLFFHFQVTYYSKLKNKKFYFELLIQEIKMENLVCMFSQYHGRVSE